MGPSGAGVPRTLVVSDLHLGGRLGHDVLRRPRALAALLDALPGFERLVLLGDLVELLQRRPDRILDVAAPVLRAIARRLPAGAEVVVVPGNHDRPLIAPWLRGRRQLSVENEVPADASPGLSRLVSWFASARVAYPGVWLREDVWATHGHYLDRHLLPQSTIGVGRELLWRRPRDRASPVEYERLRRPSAGRASSWLPQPVSEAVDSLARRLRAATMPRVGRLARPELAPLNSRLLAFQMRHASMPAMARVIHRLSIEAEWVVFGHVHRLGPLEGDDPTVWRGPGDHPKMVNTGSWLYEPRLVSRNGGARPYWPGGSVVLEATGPPRAVGLLDGLPIEAFR